MFNPADLSRLRWAEGVQLSPDGSRCAYVVRQVMVDGEHSYYSASIWVLDLCTGVSDCLVSAQRRAYAPRWSPDGSLIAYVSDRYDGNQLWVIPSGGGTARQLTRLTGQAGQPAWSPDGREIAFVSRVPALDQGDDDEPIVGPKPKIRVVRRLKYKWDGTGWWDGRYGQVFKVALSDPAPVQLTTGDYDHRAPEWSPDGRTIALVANRTPDSDLYQHEDLWLLPSAGGQLTKLTSSTGPVSHPVWSPDGQTIGYVGHDSRYERQTCAGVYLVEVSGGSRRNALEGYDYPAEGKATGGLVSQRSGSAPVFAGGGLLFISTIAGSQQIQRVSMAGGEPTPATPPGSVVYDMSYCQATGGLAFLASDPITPGDLWYLGRDGEEPRRLTDLSREFTGSTRLSLPERFCHTGCGGDEVEGWLWKPPGFDAGRKYPLVLYVHGGSSPCHGYLFNYDFQVLAADGFIVYAVNERGSQGYGQAKAASVQHQWCGPDYEDLMLGIDSVCQLPYVDADRLGVTGPSFGGLMTNWIITHTDRFAAAVAQASTSNRYSNWGTCDEGIHISEFIYPCDPWEDPAYYMERSPAVYVRSVTTPLLLVHGDEDYRCNLEQAEQMFRALKRLGKTVEIAIFLGESHSVGAKNPANLVERIRQIRRWFRKYLKETGEGEN